MYPGTVARSDPQRPAVIMGTSGEVVTYAQLDARSNQLAHYLYDAGLRPGDHLALLMENHARYLEVAWAGIRSGLYVTAINSHLTGTEAAYIINDCEATALVMSRRLVAVADEILESTPNVRRRLMVDGASPGYEPYERTIAACPTTPLDEEPYGDFMLYSSGTTGQPKGIERPLSGRPAEDGSPLVPTLAATYGFRAGCVYLSPAPMYHAAPLQFCIATHSFGGTVVVMERFDPLQALSLIERYRITHSQWVPTMFVRMLKLTDEERARFDLSSLEMAVHAAAPCPVWAKEQMIEWWGPILREYYAGTEGNGSTGITSEEWLSHKGSVGKAVACTIHICDEDGNELPTGEPGVVYFEAESARFQYHNDEAKTKSAEHPAHRLWTTLGDVGYLDEEGYLYLTDRRTFMIVAGGVNIYPQEAENVLVAHPKVADVAVFGVPNDDLGEEVKAVVQPTDFADAGPELEAELLAYCRDNLAAYKCPRSIDFDPELPRLDTGKLYKRQLRDRYWADHQSRVL
jgi:acyl-CoA synthetase (AMP-forming)/AMP-acid ligase II